MSSNTVFIKTSKRARRTDYPAMNRYLKTIRITAHVDGEEVGELEADVINLPMAFQEGHVGMVGMLFDVDSNFDELCDFAFGAPAYWLSTHFAGKRKFAYTEHFADLVKVFGYTPPNSRKRESDFDHSLLYVNTVSVNSEFRRKGIGTQLINALGRYSHLADFVVLKAFPFEGEWQNLGDNQELIDVVLAQETDELGEFYEALGFVQDDESPLFVCSPQHLRCRANQFKQSVQRIAA